MKKTTNHSSLVEGFHAIRFLKVRAAQTSDRSHFSSSSNFTLFGFCLGEIFKTILGKAT